MGIPLVELKKYHILASCFFEDIDFILNIFKSAQSDSIISGTHLWHFSVFQDFVKNKTSADISYFLLQVE